MIEGIIIKSLSWKELHVLYNDFLYLFAQNTRGHEKEKYVSDSYINSKAKELFIYLEKDTTFLIGALNGTSLIGFLWAYKRVFLEEQRIYINSLIIDEKFRNKNIGTLLLDELEKIAKANNVFILDVSTATFKEAAIRFYEKRGFKSERIQLRKEIR